MYICANCNVVPKTKPHDINSCEFCANGNIIEIKPKDITISEMIINYNEETIRHFFPQILQGTERNNAGIPRITHVYVNSGNTNQFRLGALYNNMEDFVKLSKAEIDDLCIKLYGKHNTSYAVHAVIIKSDIDDNYMIVPMSISSIVDWHRNNDIKYEGIYYKKCVWSLETIIRNETYNNLLHILQSNTRYYYNCMSSNILNF